MTGLIISPLDVARKRHRKMLTAHTICRKCQTRECQPRKWVCDTCKIEWRRANERRKYHADPEKHVAASMRQYQAAMADPQKVDRKRSAARDAYHRNADARKAQVAARRDVLRAKDPQAFLEYQRLASKKSKAKDPYETKRKDRERRKKNPFGKGDIIHRRMAQRIRGALNGRAPKRGRWEDIVGYSLEDLVSRLDATMPVGFCWDDFMAGALHIDHIRPVASFSFTTQDDPEFRACWALSNLQLLPALENIRKGARLIWQVPPQECSPLLHSLKSAALGGGLEP